MTRLTSASSPASRLGSSHTMTTSTTSKSAVSSYVRRLTHTTTGRLRQLHCDCRATYDVVWAARAVHPGTYGHRGHRLQLTTDLLHASPTSHNLEISCQGEFLVKDHFVLKLLSEHTDTPTYRHPHTHSRLTALHGH